MRFATFKAMEVLVFRHGLAGDKEKWRAAGRDDAQRPLTPEGRIKTRKAADGLAELVDRLDVIAASPLTRAEQTADALASRFKRAQRMTLDELRPEADPAKAAARVLALRAKRAAVIGHEPHLSALIGVLLGCEDLKLDLKKAGACLVELETPAAGEGKLTWLLTPKQLRALR